MRRLPLVQVLSLSALAGCSPTESDPHTLEGAFARMADAAERGARRDLYIALDDDSRHSIQAIHTAQRDALALVRRDYPEAERARASGRWRLGSDRREAWEVFAAWCESVSCTDDVRARLSSISRTVTFGYRARVRVRRGREYPFARSPAGRWGLALFAPRLQQWKVEVYRDLEAIRAAAAIYRSAKRP